MPISNPCKWFATGGSWGDQKEFHYEPGSKLFHFSPHDSGLSKTLECNIVMFANDVAHATQIVEDMLKFRIECLKQYAKANGKKYSAPFHRDGYTEMLLANKSKWVIVEAPMNQIYKIGWADNDTIL